MTPTTLHSSAACASATRGALTSRHGAIARPAWTNSLSPRGSGAEVRFIACIRSRLARLATNSPLSRANDAESLQPSLEKPTIGGTELKALKKL